MKNIFEAIERERWGIELIEHIDRESHVQYNYDAELHNAALDRIKSMLSQTRCGNCRHHKASVTSPFLACMISSKDFGCRLFEKKLEGGQQ